MNAIADDAGEPTTQAHFGSLLKHWRKRAGMSQARLAAELGYHNSVISRWETGARQPPLDQIRRIDAVLATGGRLAEQFGAAVGRDGAPGELPGRPTGPLLSWEPSDWPIRLPHHDIACPLPEPHGCTIPPADQAAAMYAAFTADPAEHTDGGTIHVLTAQLAVHSRLTEEQGPAGIHASVEATLHMIVAALRPATGPNARALLHLAAGYAGLAGQLRTFRGQHAAAMALFGKGLQWATLCDDVALRASLMCDMSSLARLEHDGASAVTYAQALPAIGPGRVWISALSHLYQARGHAILGDLRETTRNVAHARDQLRRLSPQDEDEPSWIAGVRGKILIEAGIGAALRDVAAATADRGIAHAAKTATEHSLASVPAHMRPATVLLALRLADCYACVGQPEAAAATATPVLAEAMATPMATVGHELRGLRRRLAARWPNLTSLADLLEHSQS